MLHLASNSPRRRQLLALGGWTFRLLPAVVDESPLTGESPKEYVLRLAESKVRTAATYAPPEAIIIAADTTVVDGDSILGKPRDAAEAELMLLQLRGHTHQVFTALAVMLTDDQRLRLDCCTTNVTMRNYTDEEIQAYIATGDPLDKAGAYAIQHSGFKPVVGMNECYANVVGLPLCHLIRTLRSFGIRPPTDVPRSCQMSLGYQCPVFEQILQETE
jgi:MAF protein